MWRRMADSHNAHRPRQPRRDEEAPLPVTGGQRTPHGVTRFTFCHHPHCTRGDATLQAAVRREALRLGLDLQTARALTLCDGTCQDGPFVGLPQLGLFYHGLSVGEVRSMLKETTQQGRLLFRRLYLDPTVVTDSRLIFERHQNLLIAMEEDYCLVGLVTYLFEFNAAESCGKCFPCRLGVHRVERLLSSLMTGGAQEKDLAALEEVAWTMAQASYCQFAERVTLPLRLALRLARGEFERHLQTKGCHTQERFLMPIRAGRSGPAGGEP